jgi:signal transduction histidine kinase/ActR/RegA family two-component response regulator
VRSSQPIRRKLMAMMLLTSAAAIVLTCSAFVAYELITARRQSQVQTATLARIVAANSTAALAFRDEQDASEVLGALKTEPNVLAAALYDEQGSIFASYTAKGAPAVPYPSSVQADGYRFHSGYLEGFESVSEQRDRRLGTLYIRSDTRPLYRRFWLYALIAACAMSASLLLAYVLSRLFQGQISQPILSLANTARAISERGDFSVRAPVIGEGEFRLLTTAFNQMLGRIQEQSSERRDAQAKLQTQFARLDLLQRTTRAISERQDLDSIFQVILRNLEDNLPVDFCCVSLYDAAAHTLRIAGIGLNSTRWTNQLNLDVHSHLPVDQNGLARCVRGVLVYEPELASSPFPFPQSIAAIGLHSLVAAPLLVENQVFGVLLAARTQSNSFSSADCEFLRQLSEHIALASHQVELYTQLQKAYQDLRESQQTILQQERLRALGQMASGVAHDINNAISPIALYTESLLEREPGLSERAREYLRIIQRSIDDVSQTVARMREFYRQREVQSDLVPIEINPLIEQVLALTRARWSDVPQERGIVIRVCTELAADLPRMLGTESDIRDALTNLIFNAVDAMPEGGTLTLRTQVASEASGQFSAGPAAVELAVADTGSGMDEDTLRRCFEPFFTTKGERGTGMGLAMVYGMVKRQGAQIDIDSALGRGTTIRIRFVAAAATPAAQMHLPAEISTRRLRLLIVDDDPLVAQSLGHVLQGEGHAVTIADGGQAGIDAFTAAYRDQKAFDIVMTDLGMPYVDGRAVAAAVKALSMQTPVLLLTGWGQRLSTEQSIPANVDLLLSKPPKLPELRRAFMQLLASGNQLENA